MRDVGTLRRQNELGIRGDLKIARADAGIGDGNAANFRVVLARNNYVQAWWSTSRPDAINSARSS